MTAVLQQAALLVTAAGLVCFGVAAVVARSWKPGLRMALDLWMAAGLLRLGRDSHGTALAGAAAIIAIRELVSLGLRHAERRSTPPLPAQT